jgi:DNA-directed RNA polymerase subunit RPC12/RpoP
VEYNSRFCPHCEQQRLFVRNGVNHLVHAIVTLLLCGLWLPIWIIAMLSEDPWCCSVCGWSPGEPMRSKLIKLVCPACGHKIGFQKTDGGKTGACPDCGSPVNIPLIIA